MKLGKIRTGILGLAIAAFLFTGIAHAGTATSNLQVSASVKPACNINTVNNIAFGDYDPTASSPLAAQGDVTFKCTKGTTYKAYIAGERKMLNGSEELNFQLYADSSYTTVFPSDSQGATGEVAPSSSPITKNIYGQVPAQQDVGVGDYAKTLTVTIEY